MWIANTSIEAIMFPLFLVPEHFHEGFHVGVPFQVAKKLQQKEAYWIIGKAQHRVFVSHDGADKREVNQGGDKPGKPADDTTIGMDFDIAPFVGVLRQPEVPRFGEGPIVFGVNVNTDAVEFFDDVADSKGRQISQAAFPTALRCRNGPVFFQRSFYAVSL